MLQKTVTAAVELRVQLGEKLFFRYFAYVCRSTTRKITIKLRLIHLEVLRSITSLAQADCILSAQVEKRENWMPTTKFELMFA